MIIAMSTNQPNLLTNRTNPFNYQKLNLKGIIIHRNGLPVSRTPMSKNSDQRVDFNTIEALKFLDEGGHGIALAKNPKPFLAFHHTSLQEASHNSFILN